MDFDRFDFVDKLNCRFIKSASQTQNLKPIIGNKGRLILLRGIHSERRRAHRVGIRECVRYEKFCKKLNKRNNKTRKQLLKNEKRRIKREKKANKIAFKKQKKSNKKIAKNKKV